MRTQLKWKEVPLHRIPWVPLSPLGSPFTLGLNPPSSSQILRRFWFRRENVERGAGRWKFPVHLLSTYKREMDRAFETNLEKDLPPPPPSTLLRVLTTFLAWVLRRVLRSIKYLGCNPLRSPPKWG